MVLRGGEMTTTTTRPERSLHNFTLPNLRWGSQRHLKCMKIESTSSGSGSGGGGSGDHRLRRRSPPFKFAGSSVSIPFRFGVESENRSSNRLRNAAFKSEENGGEEEGIEEFRVKIMSDLKTERVKITQSMFRKEAIIEEQDEEERKTDESSGQEKEISPVKPWNLRKRRAACKEPISGDQFNTSLNQIKNGFAAIEERIEKGGVVEAETTAKEIVRPKFSVKLTKKEIEEDFMAALGHRPPRRPKKRPRTVQKKLDNLFPGFYLTEVTLDAYKVPEETKNMQR
ncbi:hypothetical protein EUTSA_v10008407mg [Eutrema salsugineum]|uniref:Uncharacterized protein n=1 Tax=Eutrema salsugineum TaxID=72664 RepID=V4KVZ9_EUTSA|nr:hypothetical protein EUTSA_v10008407mg [Eutrema salsugineum]